MNAIKKGVSFFYSEKNTEYSTHNNTGNPIRSRAVRDLLKKVFAAEIANKGAPGKEQGPFVEGEYKQLMRMIESIKDPEKRLLASAMYCTQYNLGGRIDDVSKGQQHNLCPNKDIAHQDLSAIKKLP